jgi:exodeoxyribonuclease VIII
VAILTIPYDEYAALPGIRASHLKNYRTSPRHGLYGEMVPLEDRDSFRAGRAAHTALMEPRRFLLDYLLWPEIRDPDTGIGGARNNNAWKAFKADADQAGRTVLTLAQYETANAIADAVFAHPPALEILAGAKFEWVLTWTDEETGIECKARPDSLAAPIVADLKTTATINERLFMATAERLGYWHAQAFYRMGAAANGIGDTRHCLIAVEAKPPHDVAAFWLDDADLYTAECEVRDLLRLVATCRESGEYVGQYPEPVRLTRPGWAQPSEYEITDIVSFGG